MKVLTGKQVDKSIGSVVKNRYSSKATAGLNQPVNRETGEARDISPHLLRDTFAFRAIKLDGSSNGLRLLQERLGHHGVTPSIFDNHPSK